MFGGLPPPSTQNSFYPPSLSSTAAAASYPNNPWAPPPPAAASAATSTTPGSSSQRRRSSPQSNKKKKGKGSNKQSNETSSDESMPHNPEEVRLLSELIQMGFPDKLEILEAIRRQPPESRSADQVMMDLINHREEMEEAKKMDEARLMSEQDKVEQSRKLKAAREEALGQAKSIEDLHQVFPDSWILENNESRIKDFINKNDKRLMDEFKRLLNFEKLSLQWYGSVLPKYYYEKVRARLFCSSTSKKSSPSLSSSMKQILIEKECEILQGALYKLEEQDIGGVPKVYLEAKKEAVGEDNEVIEID